MEKEYRHLFECITPPMPDEIIYKKHPIVPITATNGSFILLNDDAPKQLEYNIGARSFPTSNYKRALIYGAFHPEEIPIVMVYNINGNPYDNRIENLVTTSDKSPEAKKIILDANKDFINESVKEMLRREKEMDPAVNMVRHFNDLGVPYNFARPWMRCSPWCEANGINVKMNFSEYTHYGNEKKARKKALKDDDADIL